MPRAPKHSAEKIYEALKGLWFIDPDGNFLPWANEVWGRAVEAMAGEMTKEYIWVYLKKDSYGVFSRIHGVNRSDPINNSSVLDSSADASNRDLNWSMNETDCGFPALRQTVVVSKEEWTPVKSRIAQYKQRDYEVLVVGWADAIYDILWAHLKLPCPFSFKTAKINRNPGEMYLTIKGSCSECGSKIHIYCQSEPISEGPTLHVSTFDTRGIVHVQKRQIRGDRRLRIGKELQGKSTYVWRREEADRLMTFGDVVPASIPSEEVARKVKQDIRDKELGVYKVQAALAQMWDWKHGEYKDTIHEIGLDKFYLMYWTPTQLFMYKKKFLKEDPVCSISIDATGRLAKQIQNPDGSQRVVFLYQAVCGYHGKILPLFQMISEKHDTNTLSYWMREWLRSGGSCPKQIVVDYSMALLNAVSLAFNNCDLKSYIENCIIAMEGSTDMQVQRPVCVIRIDIAHLIKLVGRWNCFTHETAEKKDFFLRCVGLLTTCRKIEDFVRICTDVLSVASSTHEDVNDDENHCFAAYKRLMDLLKTYKWPKSLQPENGTESKSVEVEESQTLKSLEPDLLHRFEDFEDEQSVETSSALDEIFKRIETNSTDHRNDGDRLNPYRCADFGSSLLKLARKFVLWTAVMVPDEQQSCTFEQLGDDLVASSARSEEYFRELKNLVYKKGKPIRMDKYLKIHLRVLEGTNKLLNQEGKKPPVTGPVVIETGAKDIKRIESQMIDQVDVAPKSDTNFVDDLLDSDLPKQSFEEEQESTECFEKSTLSTDSFDDYSKVASESKDTTADSDAPEAAVLNKVEDWEGLNTKCNPTKSLGPVGTRKRGKYLMPCPDIEIIHKRPRFTPALPLLRNGNRLGPTKIGKQTVQLRNTCAFDCTVQSMLAAFHDFEPYSEFLRTTNSKLSEFVQTLSRSTVSAKIYESRGSILSTTKDITNGILDCEINISYLQEKFILHDVASLERTISCTDCHFDNTKTLPVLHVDPTPIQKHGMSGLQESLSASCKVRSTSTCFRCKGPNINKALSVGNHIVLNIEDAGNPLLAARNGYPNCRKQFTLKEIPDKLVYSAYHYKMVSAIVYRGGHYSAFIKRVAGQWEEHDDLKDRVSSVPNRTLLQKHNIHVLFYVRVAKIIESKDASLKSE